MDKREKILKLVKEYGKAQRAIVYAEEDVADWVGSFNTQTELEGAMYKAELLFDAIAELV